VPVSYLEFRCNIYLVAVINYIILHSFGARLVKNSSQIILEELVGPDGRVGLSEVVATCKYPRTVQADNDNQVFDIGTPWK
jgi:hypothetical protein